MSVSTKTLVGTSVLGAVVTFILAVIWWPVLDLSGEAYKVAPEGFDTSAIKALGGDGAYFVPGIDEAKWEELKAGGEASAAQLAAFEEAWAARHRAGPVAMVIVRQEGTEPMPPSTFGWAFALDFVVALCLAWLMAQVGDTGEPYLWLRRWRSAVVAITGVAAAIQGSTLIWFQVPTQVAVMGFVEVWCLLSISAAAMAIAMTRCGSRCASGSCGCC